MNWDTLKESFVENLGGALGSWGPRLIMGIVTLIVGLFIIRKLVKFIGKALEKRQIDATLKPFLITLSAFMLKLMLFIAVAGQIGIETTSFIAVLGAAGLAIGMAFQGSLANFAGGILLLVFRPFKVGDLIEAQGEMGFVKEISVFVTVIETFQNKTVIIPNGPLAGGNIVNYSRKGNVRADFNFAVRYEADADKAREIALKVLQDSQLVLQDPKPSVYISELSENAVILTALPYTTVEDYWDVHWGMRGEIKKALGDAGFQAPYPRRVIENA